MQNVVEVACSSPPVAMNATKPAAQAVQAANQDPFDLVLQKASERVVACEQSDNANKSSDSKSSDVKRGTESAANEKVSQIKSEREVNQLNKTEKTDKPIKSEKSESDDRSKPEDSASDTTSDDVSDPATMVFGYVTPSILAAETPISGQVAVLGAETTTELTATVYTEKMSQGSSGAAVQEGIEVPVTMTDSAQTKVFSTKEAANTKIDTLTEITEDSASKTVTMDIKSESSPVSDGRSNSTKIDGKSTADLKPVMEDTIDKPVEDGKATQSSNSNNHGDVVSSVAQKYQETISRTEALSSKAVKATELETNQQTAPPDNPNGTAAVTTNAAVQTTQISEPARLAEAPKNEVITQVATQIDQLVKSNRSSIRLQLYPAELGHIDLRIVTTKDGISVTMMTEKASTQQVLKSDMDMLKQNIEQAGIQLSNLNINQGHNSNRQQSFDQRQNLSNGSYTGSSSENSKSTSDEPRVHLNSTVVDYRV